jgi:hypothetical protein
MQTKNMALTRSAKTNSLTPTNPPRFLAEQRTSAGALFSAKVNQPARVASLCITFAPQSFGWVSISNFGEVKSAPGIIQIFV